MSIKINGKQKVRKVVFNAGQNSADEPTTIQDGYATLIENGLVTRVGRIERRGYRDWETTLRTFCLPFILILTVSSPFI